MEKFSFEPNNFCHPHHDMIVLTDLHSYSWEELKKKCALLSRGWYELALLPNEDRIEFTRLFWLSKLFLSDHLKKKMESFFSTLSTIEIVLVQQKENLPYTPLMFYCNEQEPLFFGLPPASPQLISRVSQQFSHLPLPEDYLSFFSIHDGFFSTFDRGILGLSDLPVYYHRFKERLSLQGSEMVLFPFCELENVHQLHCFYKLPGSSTVANLYVDELEWNESRRELFGTFAEWLFYYVHRRRSL